MKRPIVTLLTDFGLTDHYVAAMKGVLLSIAPDAQLVDISHEVAPFAIAEAGFTLEQTVACFPAGTVHLVVVDPGVGSARRAILAEVGSQRFVGPDNGVFSRVLAGDPQAQVREITATRFFRQPVSATFHGRDIFAPVAAHLAAGTAAAEFGPVITDTLVLEHIEAVETSPGVWQGWVLKADSYGNLITNIRQSAFRELFREGFELEIGGKRVTRTAANFSEVQDGELRVITGSSGYLEVVAREASAAKLLRVGSGAALVLRQKRTAGG